ncbi:hypothetical protein Fot_19082 [Forsythia ovata]|uniref:Uncharacterized protein n=1 Tax=Forsythia ovata TaxID=205694 RepID=A0ABD1VK14_9LAMI
MACWKLVDLHRFVQVSQNPPNLHRFVQASIVHYLVLARILRFLLVILLHRQALEGSAVPNKHRYADVDTPLPTATRKCFCQRSRSTPCFHPLPYIGQPICVPSALPRRT